MLITLSACQSAYIKSVGGDPEQRVDRIYLVDFTIGWDAVLEVLKTTQLDTVNRENGFIETAWIDNKDEKNLLESAGNPAVYVKARYRLRLMVSRGFYQDKPSTRVSVTREQQGMHDVVEGWKPMDSDGVQERTLLYRIGRIISIKRKLHNIEVEHLKNEIKEDTKSEEPTPETESAPPSEAPKYDQDLDSGTAPTN